MILNYALSCSVTAPKMTQTFVPPIEFRNVFNIQQNNKLSRFRTYYPKYLLRILDQGFIVWVYSQRLVMRVNYIQ